ILFLIALFLIAFKDLFLRVYGLENCKDVTVRAKMSDSSIDSSFRCNSRGGAERGQYDALLVLVSTINFIPIDDM
ncbi:hypothetical protein Tco_0094413, partial [Tanacetum coccineum]